MPALLAIIGVGFVLGMRHATDPDHVIAVSTIVARSRSIRHAILVGAWWGVGHTFTIAAVGIGIIALGWVIPERIGLSMEFSVGLMLIVLGLANIAGLIPSSKGSDSAGYNEARSPWLCRRDRLFGALLSRRAMRPLVVGTVHGLAGSSAVALLVLATIPNPRWATLYLLVFGAGTIAGMMLITLGITAPFAWRKNIPHRLNFGIRAASGVLSLGFGLLMTYQIGIVQKLLIFR